MQEINKLIRKHSENSKKLREIYMGDKKMNYQRSLELQEKQKEEYKKFEFFLKLRKEMLKIKGE